GPAYPNLGGQNSDYAGRPLQEIPSRPGPPADHPPLPNLAKVAAGLTHQEGPAPARYLQGLPAPPHAGAARAATPASAPVAPAGGEAVTTDTTQGEAAEGEAAAGDAAAAPATDAPAEAGQADAEQADAESVEP